MLLEKKDFELMNISGLPVEKQEAILSLKDNIQMNHEGIIQYSNEVSRQITDFSSELLRSVKLKDNPEVEELLTELLGNLNTIDSTSLTPKKQGFFAKLFKTDDVKAFITKYESIESVVSEVAKKLEQAEYQLRKDVQTCNMYLQENSEYLENLDMHIVAAKMRLEEEKKTLEEKRQTVDKTDLLAVQELSMFEGEVRRLDRKVHDMLIQREIAIQNIPQIMLIRDGDAVLIEKINTGITTAIPLWERQIVISIQAIRQQNAVKLEKGVSDTTNKLIAKNAELIKGSSIAVATELERDIVDIDTLKKSNEALIQTITEIRKIQAEGAKNRLKVEEELLQLQTKLNTLMIEDKTK